MLSLYGVGFFAGIDQSRCCTVGLWSLLDPTLVASPKPQGGCGQADLLWRWPDIFRQGGSKRPLPVMGHRHVQNIGHDSKGRLLIALE